jgi:hypothetical protein
MLRDYYFQYTTPQKLNNLRYPEKASAKSNFNACPKAISTEAKSI